MASQRHKIMKISGSYLQNSSVLMRQLLRFIIAPGGLHALGVGAPVCEAKSAKVLE